MSRRRRGRLVSGWVVLDKPADLTSTQAVSRVRRLLDARKAGHAGTLDPMATGVLPIALGEATKTVAYAMDGAKRYRFAIAFGEARDSDDSEGRVTATSPVRPDRDAVAAVLERFTGDIEQVPPAFSAIKVAGERAYDLARDGEAVTLAPRRIRIDALDVIAQPDPDHVVLEAVSGKGAYMRGLARDIALALGSVGHLSALRRLAVGAFTLDDAVALPQLEELVDGGRGDEALLPLETPLDDIPAVALSDAEAHRMRSGQAVALLKRSDRERLSALGDDRTDGEALVLATAHGIPVALARLKGAELQPMRVLNLEPAFSGS